jgi:TRAP-type C4-dicarboxylate transport system substrate-binding protein
VLADDDPITVGLREMSENVEEKTDGGVQIDVYPSSQLGDTADVLEMAKSGFNEKFYILRGYTGTLSTIMYNHR